MRNREERLIGENDKHISFKGVGASDHEIKDISLSMCIDLCSEDFCGSAKREQIAGSYTIMEPIPEENAHIVKNAADRPIEKCLPPVTSSSRISYPNQPGTSTRLWLFSSVPFPGIEIT